MTGAEYERQRNKAYCRRYYLEHYEELREKRILRQQTPEHKAKQKAWRLANKDKIAASQKRYREAHREEINAKAREYMRAKHSAPKEQAI